MADTPRSDFEETMAEHVDMPPYEDRDEPEVSQSLVGLMGAFENLKQAVGYSAGEENEQFSAIEEFLQEMEAENAQLRMHAVEAIQVAEHLREENSALLDEMTQTKLDDMVEQADELEKVVLEYDQEVMEARMAEAAAVLEEVAELRVRVSELEEENTGLSEMLNEMRQSQQQLNKLQAMERQAVAGDTEAALLEGQGESSGGDHNGTPQQKGMSTPVAAAGVVVAAAASAAVAPVAADAEDADAESSPSFMTAEPGPAESTPTQLLGSPEKSVTMMTTPGKDPAAVADALSAVAGGAEGGVAATAARMLRDYAVVQATLDQERASKKELKAEVDRLNEITSSKTFKAPSAWAEREVKYKQEKEKWEESLKEAELKMAKMKEELDSLRGSSGAAALERRVEELEARLLESERDHNAAKASLHELELASRASVGEFSLTGVKPYRGPRFGEEGEVHQAVSNIESSGGTPPRASGLGLAAAAATPGGASVSFNPNNGEHATPRALGGDEEVSSNMAAQQIATLQRENTRLKAQLEKAGLGIAGAAAALETPQVVRQAMNSTTMKKAKDLEDQLASTQQERAELLKELEAMKDAAAARGAEEAQRVTLQLRIAETETRTEVALLQHGVDAESARSLAALTAQLQDAQQREQTALAKLEEIKAVSLTINVSHNANTDSAAKKEQEEEVLAQEQQVQAMQEEQEKLQEQIKEVAVAATVSPELLQAPVIPAGETSAESLPEDMAGFLAEAAAASAATAAAEETEPAPDEPAAGELPPEALERIQSLQTQLKAAEHALAALEKGVAPVQMHISVADAAAEQQQQPEPAAVAVAAPVQMRIAVNEGPSETMVKVPITLVSGEEAVASIRMPINIDTTVQEQQAPAAAPVVQPIKFSVNVSEVPETVQVPITVAGETGTTTAVEPVKFAINVAETAQPVVEERLLMPISISANDTAPTTAATAVGSEAPVRMAINIAGDQPASIHVPINVSEAARTGETAPVKIPITIATDPIKEKRMKQLEAMLKAANEEEERLRRDLEALVPVKLNFSLAGAGAAAGAGGASPSPLPPTGMSRKSSAASFEYTAEGLAQDRAAVEAAWEDHVKSTDVPSLMRAKAELETQCQMLQQQLDKLQTQLADADRENVQIHESIEDAVRSGDVGILSGLKDSFMGSKGKALSAGSRSFKVFGKRSKAGGGVSNKEMKTALHDTQDALHETEAERNALRRQLARMSKKKEKGSSKSQAAAAAGGVVGGEAAGLAAVAEEGTAQVEEHHDAASEAGSAEHDDAVIELGSLRNENSMLMEHLVTTKVRLAEVEGDYLESRRALLRSREKQMQLARQIMELQALEEPVHTTTKLDMTPPTSARGGKEQQEKQQEKQPPAERRRSLRLPGLG